jgi:hypothetical protein
MDRIDLTPNRGRPRPLKREGKYRDVRHDTLLAARRFAAKILFTSNTHALAAEWLKLSQIIFANGFAGR